MIWAKPLKINSRIDGFTLVEAMVALTIMSVVVSVAFSGLRIGLDSLQRGSRRIEEMDRRDTLERLLRQQIGSAYAWPFEIDGEKSVLFRGSDRKLEFVSEYSLADGTVNFRKIDYVVNTGLLLYGEKPLYAYSPADKEEPPAKEFGRFHQLSFSFWDGNRDGDSKWVTQWTDKMGLPAAVRVRVDDDVLTIVLMNRPS
jgi:general secretion pathway protein J